MIIIIISNNFSYHLESVEGSVHTATQNSLYASGTLTFAGLCLGNSFEYIAIGDASVFALTAVGMLAGYFAGAAHEFNKVCFTLFTYIVYLIYTLIDAVTIL